MDAIPYSTLVTLLIILLILSAFFSSSETALMAINRYRLKHKAKNGNKAAIRTLRLLKKPDRLIGIILLGNNLVNIFAASVSTVIAIKLIGDKGPLVAPLVLTPLMLIFSEVAPKTWAAVRPESLALPASAPLLVLLKLFYPVVAVINSIANLLLKPFGLDRSEVEHADQLSLEEIESLLNDTNKDNDRHHNMLLNILDLQNATVADILVPRTEVMGIDLEDDWDQIIEQITNSFYTRLPIYTGNIDNVIGILHVRTVISRLARGELDMKSLRQTVRKPYFIPETTTLTQQLLEFQERERRMALVVDEYGDIQGLLTLDDILEDVVGQFTTEPKSRLSRVHKNRDGSFIVDGGENVRSLNRRLGWTLPTEGARTLNGLILETAETIPEKNTTITIADLDMCISEIEENVIKSVRIMRHQAETETTRE